jgi:hypothetical protein
VELLANDGANFIQNRGATGAEGMTLYELRPFMEVQKKELVKEDK